MNIEILERVKARIKQAPRNFFMHSWIVTDLVAEEIQHGYCGTTMCIGGWGMTELGMNEKELYNRTRYTADPREVLSGLEMAQALGLPNTKLFYVQDWPQDLNALYEAEEDKDNLDFALLAEIACNAIDSYIQTNGWSDGSDDDEPDHYDREPNW